MKTRTEGSLMMSSTSRCMTEAPCLHMPQVGETRRMIRVLSLSLLNAALSSPASSERMVKEIIGVLLPECFESALPNTPRLCRQNGRLKSAGPPPMGNGINGLDEIGNLHLFIMKHRCRAGLQAYFCLFDTGNRFQSAEHVGSTTASRHIGHVLRGFNQYLRIFLRRFREARSVLRRGGDRLQ